MKTVLTIAGSDCSGGAGIQADIKTITAHNLYAMSAITALTAQNTMGVTGVSDVSPEFLKMQLDAIFEDIYPDAVKIGMVSNIEIIETIVERLTYYNAKNIVVDPVMVATSGSKLLKKEAVEAVKKNLIPLADIITPNISEAEVLSGIKINTSKDMEISAQIISKMLGGAVLVKGGHIGEDANDLILYQDNFYWIDGKRIDTDNTHGTGCTLSSAIACNLAQGFSIQESVSNAKKYITGALSFGLNLGNGSGPLNHMYGINL